MNTPCIFNIQKFSIHDGPGIRTTIFFKGCPLRCLWCHNPEGQRYQAEPMLDKDEKKEQIGQYYSIPELVKQVQADQIFYDQSGGGVTLSGGEVMTQDMDYVETLCRELQRVGISVVIDTCGYAPKENFTRILPYTDLFLYDLKCIDSLQHEKYVGVPNQLILDNLKYLSDQGARIDLRLILVDHVNTSDELIHGIGRWLQEQAIAIERITLLPYHDFGRDKYKKLGRYCTQNFEKPNEKTVEKIQSFFKSAGYCVNIGG